MISPWISTACLSSPVTTRKQSSMQQGQGAHVRLWSRHCGMLIENAKEGICESWGCHDWKGTFNTECYIRKSTGSQVIGVWTAELSRGRVMRTSVHRQQVKIEALGGDSSGAESLLGMCEALRSTPSTTEIRTKSSRHRSSKIKDRNMLGI